MATTTHMSAIFFFVLCLGGVVTAHAEDVECLFKGFNYSYLTNETGDYIVKSGKFKAFEFIFNVCKELQFQSSICPEGTVVCERTINKTKAIDDYGNVESIQFFQDADRNYAPYMQVTADDCEGSKDQKPKEARVYLKCSDQPSEARWLYEDSDDCMVHLEVEGPCKGVDPKATLVQTFTIDGLGSLFKSLSFEYIPDLNFDVEVYKVEYSSKLLPEPTEGQKAYDLSGIMMVPKVERHDARFFAAFHDLILKADQIPSNAFGDFEPNYGKFAIYAGLAAATNGDVVVLPDGIGYGSSSEDTAAFLLPNYYAVTGFNFIEAARLLIPDISPNMTLRDELRVAGYGSGGFAAMSLHKISTDPVWETARIRVTASYPSGGPYDLGNTQLKHSLSDLTAQTTSPAFMAFGAYSYRYYKVLNGDIFNDTYTDKLSYWFGGTQTEDQVNTDIRLEVSPDLENLYLTQLLDAVKEKDGNSPLIREMENEGLVSSFDPSPESQVRLCHGEKDDVVFVENALQVMDANENNVEVQIALIPETECSSHAACMMPCLAELYAELAGRSSTTTTTTSSTTTTTKEPMWYTQTDAQIGMGAGGGMILIVLLVLLIMFIRKRKRKDYDKV